MKTHMPALSCLTKKMRTAAWFFGIMALSLTTIAQTPRDFAIDLRATVSDTAPCITLSWSLRQANKIASQKLHRRLKNASGMPWELQATLASNATTYADSSAVPGIEYEYWLQRSFAGLSPSPAVGYLKRGREGARGSSARHPAAGRR